MKQNSSTMDIYERHNHACMILGNSAGQTVYHKRKEEKNEQEKRIHSGI